MSNLDASCLEPPISEHDVSPGDLVSLDAHAGALYQVVAIHAEKAWVSRIQGSAFAVQGSDFVVCTQRCRRIEPEWIETLH